MKPQLSQRRETSSPRLAASQKKAVSLSMTGSGLRGGAGGLSGLAWSVTIISKFGESMRNFRAWVNVAGLVGGMLWTGTGTVETAWRA